MNREKTKTDWRIENEKQFELKKKSPTRIPGKNTSEHHVEFPRQIDFVFVSVFQGCFWTFSGNVLGITCKIHSICIQRSWPYSFIDITLSSFNVASRCWSKLMYYMHRSPLWIAQNTRWTNEPVGCMHSLAKHSVSGCLCVCDAARPTSRFNNGLIQNWIVKTLVLVWI